MESNDDSSCNWFPQAPNCGHGSRTSSCQYHDACICDDGWTTDFTTGESTYAAYLSQCNTPVEVYEAQQTNQVNRTAGGTEHTIVPAPGGVKGGRMNTTVIGVILLAIVGMLLVFFYWRRRKRNQASTQGTTQRRPYKVEETMPRIHPYLDPYTSGMMYAPPSYASTAPGMQYGPQMFDMHPRMDFQRRQEDSLVRHLREDPYFAGQGRSSHYRSSSNEELPFSEHYSRHLPPRQPER